jgi:hypothetical protein
MGNFFQRQAMAVPADINDPLLKKWIKPTTNPFLVQVRPNTAVYAATGNVTCLAKHVMATPNPAHHAQIIMAISFLLRLT